MDGRIGADTIAAIATAPGRGALAVVRISGPLCGGILEGLCPAFREHPPVPRRATLARVVDPDSGELLDRALVTWFPGPDSYTGEDVAEISLHGGALGPALVLDACLRGGARVARAGEFTQRGYLNGKVDLLQAEGVRDLVEAESEVGRRAALFQAEGALSGRLREVREGLLQLEVLLVYHVDFPEEDEPPVPIGRIAVEARAVAERLESLLATAPEGELLRDGALTVLAGRPNSGKSSLFNALLGETRAIVTDEPGTTRDAIEARVAMGGFPFRFVDTAGIREEAGGVERLGIEVARRYLARADVVLVCCRAEEEWGEVEEGFLRELPPGTPVIPLRTAADRGHPHGGTKDGSGRMGAAEVELEVSVVDGTGLEALRERLVGLVFRGIAALGAEVPVLTRRRQREGVERAFGEVLAFADALEGGIPAEVAAAHLRAAESAVEELLGIISGEEVLERVFTDFCIGK